MLGELLGFAGGDLCGAFEIAGLLLVLGLAARLVPPALPLVVVAEMRLGVRRGNLDAAVLADIPRNAMRDGPGVIRSEANP